MSVGDDITKKGVLRGTRRKELDSEEKRMRYRSATRARSIANIGKRSGTFGNVRAALPQKEIVVECENKEISAYRRMTDLSSPPSFNFDCPQSIERRALDRGNVDMQ